MKRFRKSFLWMMVLVLLTGTTAWAAEKPAEKPAAQIEEACYTEPGIDYRTPVVIVEDAAAMEAINNTIQMDAGKVASELRKDNLTGANITSTIRYEMKCNRLGIVSFTEARYRYAAHAANGTTYVKAYMFNTLTGQQATLADVQALAKVAGAEKVYTLEAVNAKLVAQAKAQGKPLYQDFAGLKELPQEIYLDSNMHFHAIVQEMEAAPHAAGIIDIDLDAE